MKKKEELNLAEIFKDGIPEMAIACEIINGKPVWLTDLDANARRNKLDVVVYHQHLLSKLPSDFPHGKDCIYYLGNGTERNNEQALKTWVRGVLSGEIDLPENGMEGLELVYTTLLRTIAGE